MARVSPNYLTEEEAKQLAAKIQQFWHDQGRPEVRVWTEKGLIAPEKGSCWNVRSNLVRGNPPPPP
jgi:hypothetical protein